METKDRIAERMKALNLRAVDVVRKTAGTNGPASKASVSHWLAGNATPSGVRLIVLARLLECSPMWLISGEGSPERKTFDFDLPFSSVEHAREELIGSGGSPHAITADAIEQQDVDLWDDKTEFDEETLVVPFHTEVSAAAGAGLLNSEHTRTKKIPFSKLSLRKAGINPGTVAACRVNGDSNAPVIPDGSTIMFDTSKTEIKDGQLYLINHEGMLRVKRVFRMPGNGYRLKSYNDMDYPDEIYDGDQANNIVVIGQVVWYAAFL